MLAPPPDACACLLIVEDDAAFRYAMERMLSSARWSVTGVDCAEAALQQVTWTPPDVVICDVRLPGRSGLELIGDLRAQGFEGEIIVVTGVLDDALGLQCLQAGAVDVLHKPFDELRLQLSVERALERRALIDARDLLGGSREILRGGVDDVPSRIAKFAARALDAEEAHLFLPLPQGGFRAVCSKESCPDCSASPASTPSPVGGLRLVHPLRSANDLVGILEVRRNPSRSRFTKRDAMRFGVVASQAVLAVENDRLSRQLIHAERLAAIGEMVAGVAHEINTPAAYIRANIDFAVDELASRPPEAAIHPEILEALSECAEGVRRIHALVSDLRVFSHSGADALSEVQVNQVLGSVLRMALPAASEVELTLDLPDDLVVLSNPNRLTQVLLNLVRNAAQAMSHLPGSSRRLWIRGSRDVGMARIEIEDAGPGVPAELADQIFIPFFTTKPSEIGTGLGLPLARRIIESHRGTLTLESRAPKGACFRVCLPAPAT